MSDVPYPADTSDWPAPNDYVGWVKWRTKKLLSGDPYWQPIADRLVERGLDPQTLILADSGPEDVPANDRVFELEYDWLHKPWHEGSFRSWRDLTESWETEAHPKESVVIALRRIASDR